MPPDAPKTATPAGGARREAAAMGWLLPVLLGLAALATVVVVVVPAVLIRPFSPQTPAMVATAYALRTVSPWIAPLGAALTALLAGLVLHRRPSWPQATVAAVTVVAAGGAAWFSHQNHFEWMFEPLPGAEFARARDVTFVADSDMVVAIEVNGDAVAYPVRQMAYHHLFNDEVGKLPVVSTY